MLSKRWVVVIIVILLIIGIASFILVKKYSRLSFSFGNSPNFGSAFRARDSVGNAVDSNMFDDVKLNPFSEETGNEP